MAISNQTYTGAAITPEVTVQYGKSVLTNNTDYTVSYSNNINAGKATVTVAGKGNFTGTLSSWFNISRMNASGFTVSPIPDQIYTGAEIRPSVTVTNGKTLLVKDRDYTISYRNNLVYVGPVTVSVNFTGNYTGTKTLEFNIVPKNVNELTVSPIADQMHNGSAITPNVSVKDGDITLIKNANYTLSYSNNVDAGKASVTITGKGNYTGERTVYFNIIGNYSEPI